MLLKHVIWLLIFLTTVIATGVAQSNTDEICKDSTYHVLKKMAGDNVTISCDTVFILNKSTYHLLTNYYHDYKAQNELLKDFLPQADVYINDFKLRLKQDEEEFRKLQEYFDQLSVSSGQLVLSTKAGLVSIDSSLDSIRHNIVTAKNDLNDVQKMVHDSEKKKWLFGAVGGAIGFGVGFIMATTIVLLATN